MKEIHDTWEKEFAAYKCRRGPEPLSLITGVVSWCYIYRHHKVKTLDLSCGEFRDLTTMAMRNDMIWLLDLIRAADPERAAADVV